MIPIIFFWIVWVFNGLEYESWEAQLVDEDIPGAMAALMPNHNLIYLESMWYPQSGSGCDILMHEYRHIQLMYEGWSSSMHHAIMRAGETYC